MTPPLSPKEGATVTPRRQGTRRSQTFSIVTRSRNGSRNTGTMDRRHPHKPSSSSSPATTYRYTRRQLAQHNRGVDLYNTMAMTQREQQQPWPPLEYWTNGRTTHLMVVPPTAFAAASSDDASATTATFTNRRSSSSAFESSPSSTIRATTTASPEPRYLAASSATNAATQSQQLQTDASSSSLSTNQIFRQSLMAGSVSGMASTLLLYPLDVLRTKLQAAGRGARLSAVVTQTWRYDGVRAFYTGVTLPLAAQVLYKGTIFSVHAVTQEWIRDFKLLERQKLGQDHHHNAVPPLDYVDTAFSGLVAGAVNAAAFVTPVELVRNQMIAQDSKLAAGQAVSRLASSSWDMVRWTIQSHGASRLWRGMTMTVLRDGIGVAAFFVAKRKVEETLAEYYNSNHHHQQQQQRRPTFATSVLAGGLAGLAFWVVSLPFDTMKTWIQSGELSQPPVHVTTKLRQIMAEGQHAAVARRLLRGWQVAYVRGVPSAAITVSVYSTVYHLLEQRG